MGPWVELDSSAWWAALRMHERLPAPGAPTGAHRDRGKDRLAGWRTGRAVTGGLVPDLSRWHEAGLGEDDLRFLLGETPEGLRDRLPQVPQWLECLAGAWAADPVEEPGSESAPHDVLGPAAGLLALVHPLSSWYRNDLCRQVNQVARDAGHLDEIPLGHPLFTPNHETYLTMTAPVLARHLSRASAAGALVGATPEERFADFVRQLREPATALPILAEYPTLARELVDEAQTWLTVRRELAVRLLCDLEALRSTFGLTATSLNDVVDIRTGVGDTHRGGRSVAILTFRDGDKVVYKPRGLAVEARFSALVDWLNARGLTHALRTPAVLERDGYGWVEFAPAHGCADEAGLRRFYWRQGAYLALLHALRATDIHLENVIASGEHPMIIDLEALFQQPQPMVHTRPVAAPDAAVSLAAESVLSVGLLPTRSVQRDGEDVTATELSGLAGGNGELTPMKVPLWQDMGTDRMRRVRHRLTMPAAQNLPTVDGEVADPARYQDDLLAGFGACYRILLAGRAELLAPDGPVARFGGDEVRFLVLPTKIYGRILQESWHPAVLGDALDRECLFELLATRHPDLRANHAVAASEIRQLARRDIPFFWTRPDSRDLYDDEGIVARDFLPCSGLDLVRERIAGLSAADLRQQSWTVAASLAALQIGDTRREWRPRVRPVPTGDRDEHAAERAATLLGDNLLQTAVENPEQCPVWLTLTMVADRYWGVLPTGFENFSGLGGIALFLGYLGERTGQPRFRHAAEAIATSLHGHVDALLRWDLADRDMLSIGGFGELGGYIHTLTHLGALWHAPDLLRQAHRLVPDLVRRIATDRDLDVLTGTAGAALALRALHSVDPDDRTLAALRAAGDRLVATAVTEGTESAWRTTIPSRAPLLGFSHGAAGIAYALIEIFRATGEPRFLDVAANAVRHEYRRFDPAEGNWPDHRDVSPDGSFMNSWCHGAAGIGLARAAMLEHLAIPEVRIDLAAALAAVRRDLMAEDGTLTGTGNDCLCHGDAGLAETLLTAGLRTGDPVLVADAHRAARSVARTVLDGAELCGVPRGLHVPGLLMGTAGIGYGLLRAARPDRTPNVLLLEPPTS